MFLNVFYQKGKKFSVDGDKKEKKLKFGKEFNYDNYYYSMYYCLLLCRDL